MKVLQINSVCGVGSTGRIATDIHSILIAQGHESYIAYGRGKAKNIDDKYTIKIGNNIDTFIHVAKTRIFDKHGFGSKNATRVFIERLKELDPDIIHLHNIHGYYINNEVLFHYLKETNKPVVWTFHDCWSFTGHCAYFDYVGCDKWKSGCNSCPEKKAYPSSLIVDNSKYNFKAKKEIFTGLKNLTITTPSRWLANLVKESFFYKYPVKVINNGIDLNLFRPIVGKFRKKYDFDGKYIILGVASVWDRRKGLKYFVELADKISKDEVIVLVGLTKNQMKQVPPNIIGITRTNNIEELIDIYSNADVFVNPTLEDNYPTTNLEALACGTPVVTFDTGGSPESIVQNNTGYVTRKKTTQAIVEALSIIRNGKYKRCRQNSKINSKSRMAKAYITTYTETIDIL